MKVKRSGKSGVVAFELDRAESQLPVQAPDSTSAPLPEFHLTKILVPVDFSNRSDKAIAYAIALAKQFEAGITLLHVVRRIVGSPELNPVEFDQEEIKRSRLRLNETRLEVRKACPCEAIVLSGAPEREIVSLAVVQVSDLIILSTHGRTGLSRAIQGSVTERVVRTAPCPVLVVKEKEHEFLDTNATPDS